MLTKCSEKWAKLGRLILLALVSVTAASTMLGAQAYKVLANFECGRGQIAGFGPPSIVTQGRDANLYVTAMMGDSDSDEYGYAFYVKPTGGFQGLHGFYSDYDHNAPIYPGSGLRLGKGKNCVFYGTTTRDSRFLGGSIFKLSCDGNLKVLHQFADKKDGYRPYAAPVEDSNGNLYGTTSGEDTQRLGTVYKLNRFSDKFTTLHQFAGTDGSYPYPPLIQANDGNFYGTTQKGGAFDYGTIFRITPGGKFTVLYEFDYIHGANPLAPLLQARDGNFYGTTTGGGSKGHGAVFKLTPSGTIKILHDFRTKTGVDVVTGLEQATDGSFYGVASAGGFYGYGTIFRISPKGRFTVLHKFDYDWGAAPKVAPLQHTNGLLYGVADAGGQFECASGVAYSLDVGLAPFVRLVSSSAKAGQTVGILGQGLTGTTGVSFNGVPASFIVSSDTYLDAIVPEGASRGSVVVETPTGTLVSNNPFGVLPEIHRFHPSSGPVGTPVTILGNAFAGTMKVLLGGVAATNFTVDSDLQITAIVPAGAQSGAIKVRNPSGEAYKGTFTVTP